MKTSIFLEAVLLLLDFTARDGCCVCADTIANNAAFLPIRLDKLQSSSQQLFNLSVLSSQLRILPKNPTIAAAFQTTHSSSRGTGGSVGRNLSRDDGNAGIGFGSPKKKGNKDTATIAGAGGTPIDITDDTTKKVILEITASKIKVGGLKFFLQLFIVGERDTPTEGSWILNMNEKDGDGSSAFDVYYKDGTGMFSVIINEEKILVERNGDTPSLQYQLQESVMLHSILDQLETVAYAKDDDGNSIDIEKRLLVFENDEDNTAISKLRENLPARKA